MARTPAKPATQEISAPRGGASGGLEKAAKKVAAGTTKASATKEAASATKKAAKKVAAGATKASATKEAASAPKKVAAGTTKASATKKAASAPKKAAARATKASAPKKAAAGPKTRATGAPVTAFLSTLDASTRADCDRLDAWMTAATGSPGVMYGKAIVGYGASTIRYADGREAPWMKIGFSPRKQALTLYGVLAKASPSLLKRLGKHDTGKGCLYIKRLTDVDAGALEAIIRAAGGS
jgi:hypothetical protein